MQDIAGCRIVVPDILEQETYLGYLRNEFKTAIVVDRRENPSFGYRAVHVIPVIDGKDVEIQVRSVLQHLWAELSEKASDVLDPSIKYGGGIPEWQMFFKLTSAYLARYEEMQIAAFNEIKVRAELKRENVRLSEMVAEARASGATGQKLVSLKYWAERSSKRIAQGERLSRREEADRLKKHDRIERSLRNAIVMLDRKKEQPK